MDIVTEITEMREKLEKAKPRAARLEGQLDQLDKEFSKHGCKNIDEAVTKLEELEETKNRLEKDLETDVQTLKDAYNWDTI